MPLGHSPHEYLTGLTARQTGPNAACALLRCGTFFGENRSAQDMLKLPCNRSPRKALCRPLRRVTQLSSQLTRVAQAFHGGRNLHGIGRWYKNAVHAILN